MSDAAELEQPYLELFKHIIKYLDDPTTDGLIFASRIRTIAERGFNVGMVRSGLSWLTKHGFLNIVQESSQNGTCWELSSKGTAVAYQLIALANLPITTGSNVPTADSVPITFHDKPLTFHGTPLVWSGQMPTDLNAPTPDSRQSEANIPPNLFRDIDHSSAEFKDVIETLDRLSGSVKGANDLSVSGVDRLCILSDITRFRDLLQEPRIRVASLSAFITGSGTSSWLAREAVSSVVKAAALEVVKAVWKLITSLVGVN